MNATEAVAAGAGLLRRLRRHAGDVVFFGLALLAAWLLWPTSLGGCTTVTIVSGQSMEPTYYTGDLVVSRCGDYEVGDVVVYNPPDVGGARVIHRIIGGDAQGWVIQGDNNDFIDPWEPADERVLGKAVLHVPKAGFIGSVLINPMTWLSLFLIAGALLVWPTRSADADVDDDDEPSADEPSGGDLAEEAPSAAVAPEVPSPRPGAGA